MRRSYRSAKFLGIIDTVREHIPDAAITTDIIVGFPGETEEDFQGTLDVVRESRFSSAFTFQYSIRPGTPAATMADQVPKAVVQERFERLIALQEEICWAENRAVEGREVEVLVAPGEGRKDAETHRLSGRARDNRLVHFAVPEGAERPRPGDLVTVGVTYGAPHHLVADAALEGGDLRRAPHRRRRRLGGAAGRPPVPGKPARRLGYAVRRADRLRTAGAGAAAERPASPDSGVPRNSCLTWRMTVRPIVITGEPVLHRRRRPRDGLRRRAPHSRRRTCSRPWTPPTASASRLPRSASGCGSSSGRWTTRTASPPRGTSSTRRHHLEASRRSARPRRRDRGLPVGARRGLPAQARRPGARHRLRRRRRRVEFDATGWFARCMQHEYDHLNGSLYVDRLDDRSRKKARKAVKRNGWGKPATPGTPASTPTRSGTTSTTRRARRRAHRLSTTTMRARPPSVTRA